MPASSAPLTRYALVDVDACYCACERIFHPELEGVPVVVLSNNDGCVISRSSEATALGVEMGAPWLRIRNWAARRGVVARSSNYELYGSISRRLMDLLHDVSPAVEAYSIDEAFIRVQATDPDGLAALGRRIRATVRRDLGIPVSVGIGPTKTLAKLASHGAKHSRALGGVAVWDQCTESARARILQATPAAGVWGVGRRTARRLAARGIDTAGQLHEQDPGALRQQFGVNLARTVLELRGTPCIETADHDADRSGRLMFSRSFSTPVTTADQMHQVLSLYAQQLTSRLRRQGSVAGAVWAFAATSPCREPFHQVSAAAELPERTDDPLAVLRSVSGLLEPRMAEGARYVRAGICLSELAPAGRQEPLPVFAADPRGRRIGAVIDEVNTRVGHGAVGLGLAGLACPPDWQMRRGMLSNRGTTCWAELTTVRA